MTRFDDSFSCKRRSHSHLSSRVSALCRASAFAFSAAIGLAAGAWSSSAFSATYGYGSSPSSVSAAAKSPYLAAQRQQAQYQQQVQAQQHAQAQQRVQAQQYAQARQAQAQQAQRPQASPNFFSGLWGGNSSSSQQASGGKQRLAAPSLARPSEPQRNNVFGLQPRFQRSPQQFASQQRQPAQAQRPLAALAPNRPNAAPQSGRQGTAPSAESLAQASTDLTEGRELLTRIPWDALSPKAKEKIQHLAASPTIYRRLPMAGGRCNPELFDFFLSHPNGVVELWRAMGYEDIEMVAEAPNLYSVKERKGSYGKVQILYQDTELTLAYCAGSYRGPAFWRPINGEMFLVLQTRYTEDANKTPFVVCRLDAFADLREPGAELLARAFSAAIGKIADSNFEQTLAFIDSVSQSIETNPEEFQQVVLSLQGLSPEARGILAAKAARVGGQADARRRGQVVEYQLLPKMNLPTSTYARILGRGNQPVAPRASAPAPDSELPSAFSADSGSLASSGAPSRSASLGRSIKFNRNSILPSDDFSLADFEDDFESSIEWDDEPSATKVYASKGPPMASGSSLARVGAKPSTHSAAMSLLDEQESRLAPSYSRPRLDTLKTVDEDDDEDFSLAADDVAIAIDDENDLALDDEELALDDSFDVGDSSDLVAMPAALSTEVGKPNALANDAPAEAVAAAPLVSTEEDEFDNSDLIFLDFPEEMEFEEDFEENAAELSTPETANDEPLVIDFEELGDEEASVSNALADDEPFVVVARENAADAEKTEAEFTAPSASKANQETVDKASKSGESFEIRNQKSGWTPVVGNSKPRAPKKVEKVAMNVEPRANARAKSDASSSWSGASDERAPSALPSKFVTRHYTRAEVDEKVLGEAKTLATFDADWEEPERVTPINSSDSPTFKKLSKD